MGAISSAGTGPPTLPSARGSGRGWLVSGPAGGTDSSWPLVSSGRVPDRWSFPGLRLLADHVLRWLPERPLCRSGSCFLSGVSPTALCPGILSALVSPGPSPQPRASAGLFPEPLKAEATSQRTQLACLTAQCRRVSPSNRAANASAHALSTSTVDALVCRDCVWSLWPQLLRSQVPTQTHQGGGLPTASQNRRLLLPRACSSPSPSVPSGVKTVITA